MSLENSVVRNHNKMNNMNLWWIIAVIHIDFLKVLGFLKVLARSDPSRPRSLAIIYTRSTWSKSIIHITLAFEKFNPKMFRPERDSNPWPQRYRCSALPTELWNHLVLTFRVRNMPHALEIRSWNYIDMKSLESPMSRLIAELAASCLILYPQDSWSCQDGITFYTSQGKNLVSDRYTSFKNSNFRMF